MTLTGNGQSAENTDDKGTISTLQPDKIYVSQFVVSKMDCPSEERIIQMALEGIEPDVVLEFDTPNRMLRYFTVATLSPYSLVWIRLASARKLKILTI